MDDIQATDLVSTPETLTTSNITKAIVVGVAAAAATAGATYLLHKWMKKKEREFVESKFEATPVHDTFATE